MRGATDDKYYSTAFFGISIHAPRAGSDPCLWCWRDYRIYFNPRSPCGERRWMYFLYISSMTFQSTLPVRGATAIPLCAGVLVEHFNPRSPCGERQTLPLRCPRRTLFQSTLPVRGATSSRRSSSVAGVFQSTLPVRGATYRSGISKRFQQYFNPRSPCGERPFTKILLNITTLFQSTLPVRGATVKNLAAMCSIL